MPYLIDRLNEGALFYSFQGHANRTLLTSEAGFATRKEYDHLRLLRAGSPVHIFIGIGCHISEFALTSELSQEAFAGPGGDCLSEQLLFKSGAGAVSSYASSAFEYLGDNAHYCETLHRVLFQKPPTGPMHPAREQTGAHWVLGEAIAEAEIIQIDSTSYGYDQMFRYMLLGDPHLSVDPGPPLMALEADWGEGWIAVDRDSLRARNGTNTGIFRFTVSDVVALDSTITFEVGGEDRSGDLAITAARDPGLDFARSYTAEFRHTLSLNDGSFLFKVYRPDSAATQHPSGFVEFPLGTSVRLFYNEYLEILPGGESPPTGDFRLIVDFPVYLAEAPELLLDGLRMGGVRLEVTDPADSLHWEARFSQTFAAGTRMLTVRAGGFEYDFVFVVAGDDLVLDTFNFPNPFSEGTNIVYVVNLPIERGEIEIYNVSGTLIRTFDIPPSMLDASNYQQPHSLYWDGRDLAGDPVANGTYFYLIKVERGGSSFDVMGKSVKLR